MLAICAMSHVLIVQEETMVEEEEVVVVAVEVHHFLNFTILNSFSFSLYVVVNVRPNLAGVLSL